MLTVIVYPGNFTEQQIEEELMKMRDFIVKKEPNLIVYFQIW